MSNVTKLKSIIESVAALALLVKLDKGHERTVMRLNRVVNRLKVVQLKYERTLARDAKGTAATAKKAPAKGKAKPAAARKAAPAKAKAKPAASKATPTTTVASSTASH